LQCKQFQYGIHRWFWHADRCKAPVRDFRYGVVIDRSGCGGKRATSANATRKAAALRLRLAGTAAIRSLDVARRKK
jgi:hypothetical protein